MDSLAISDSLITAFPPGQVFFVESVCDDPDVIAANILVGEPLAHTSLCLVCVCGWGGWRVSLVMKVRETCLAAQGELLDLPGPHFILLASFLGRRSRL